jgi:hypothetical protein
LGYCRRYGPGLVAEGKIISYRPLRGGNKKVADKTHTNQEGDDNDESDRAERPLQLLSYGNFIWHEAVPQLMPVIDSAG